MAIASKLNWHSLESSEALEKMKSSATGLSEEEASRRLKQFGFNQLPKQKPYSKLRLFLNQFNNPLMFVLIGTILISFYLKHFSDAVFIGIVMVSNIIVAFWQENKAGNAIKSLKKMVTINTKVLRDGKEKQIDSKHLVPGDVITLHPGDKVPADARVLQTHGVKVNESSLTGESLPISKREKKVSSKAVLADRSDMVFMGTTVEEGSVKAVIVATGSNTQMGEIVQMLKTTEEALTPLQIQMARLAKIAATFLLGLVAVIFLIGILRRQDTGDILLASLSLGVAAIPADLLPAITLILVLAMRRILKQNGLVRKLVSSETLGNVSVICTDKTGTLTQGKMGVTHLITKDKEISGKALKKFNIDDADPTTESLKQLAKISVLNNDAFVENPEAKPDQWLLRGKITEQALLKAAMQMGFDKKLLDQEHLLIDKLYFSSELKYSATLREVDGGDMTGLFVIGAPEVIFSKVTNLSFELEEKTHLLATQGLRVLAAAYREFSVHPKYGKLQEIVNDLNLIGLIALEDPIREEVIESIKITKKAGIKTVIVTGDHRMTASVVARQIGLNVNDSQIIEGNELDNLNDEELRDKIMNTVIFSRVSPSHKLRIVDAFQAHNQVVAMVGDGVNDAPALKSADIGVAVHAGTDVAKEVADLVLMDNGFHSIVKAIEQGRVIFSNIRKVFVYLVADGFQELFVFLTAMILGLPIPILPTQILWINLVEDGLPDLALTTEQETNHVMDQQPRPKNEPVLSPPLRRWLTSIFFIAGTAAAVLFIGGLKLTGWDLEKVRTMVFVLSGLDSLVFTFSIRSFRQIIFRRDIFSNKFVTSAVAISFALLVVSVYAPPLQKLLHTQSLGLVHWAILFGFVFVEIVFIELAKMTFLFKKGRALV